MTNTELIILESGGWQIDKVVVLKTIDLLQSIPDSSLRDISGYASITITKRGEVISTDTELVYFLLNGTLQVSQFSKDGRICPLVYLAPPDMLFYVQDELRVFRDATMISLPLRLFCELVHEYHIEHKVMQKVASVLQRSLDRVALISLRAIDERVDLVRRQKILPAICDGKVPTHFEVAEILGLARESVSRYVQQHHGVIWEEVLGTEK